MPEMPSVITGSSIWRSSLAPMPDDPFAAERERLRVELTKLRSKAALLAGEIRGSLPELTLHDISHLDALWETASTIAGERYLLTPAEAFVLGGAFLLHDLGMALPAVDGGIAGLQMDPRWADLVTYEYQNYFQRDPSPQELREPSEEIRKTVLFALLRQVHAANAERLIFLSFRTGPDPGCVNLMDDSELRQIFGRTIGRVAHSHWWSLTEVEREFQRTIGAPHWCPPAWTVDPLKLACILRCADAAQIDARRAPLFLKALSRLSATSEDHWTFQGKLNKPYIAEDALVFTTGQAFSMSEAPAWWLCLETLRMIDDELGSVDALFADKGCPRFAARRVTGVDSPERLVSYIQTDGWLPINATIHVTDLPRVIKSVGGEELYGRHPEVAIRELIQNASDAIHARRVYERRPDSYGAVRVSLSVSPEGHHWLEVSDDGIGMSRTVLTEFLLDFGRAFWGSSEMQQEFPGLLSSGIKQIGKYGIGFFAVFMLAEHVQVITRRSDAGARDTLVLEFSSGLRGRPILRAADPDEQLIDGGTRVRIQLKTDPFGSGGFLYNSYTKESRNLSDLCLELCPALEVDLNVGEDATDQKLIAAGDWRRLDSRPFLERMPLMDDFSRATQEEETAFRDKAAANVRFLRDENGSIIGRALLTAGHGIFVSNRLDLAGVVTIGGLRSCGLSGISGVLVGMPMRASRDAAKPLVTDEELSRWATEQASLVPSLWGDPKSQSACAQYVRLCGGNTGDLPICIHHGEWCSASEIRVLTDLADEVIFLDHFVVEHEFSHLDSYQLKDNVFVVASSGIPGLLQCYVRWPREMRTGFAWGGGSFNLTLAGVLLEAIAESWGADIQAIVECNNLNREGEVIVATSGEREISARAIVVKKATTE